MVVLSVEPHGKAVVVKGDTRAVKDFLKGKGGSWNKGLVGWIFPGSKKQQLLADLRGHAGVTSVTDRCADAGAEVAPAVSASGDGGRGAKRPSEGGTSAQAKRASTSSEETVINISDSGALRCTVSAFVGKIGVDIRRFYKDRDSGEMKPTPKGIRVDQPEWAALCGAADEVGSAGEDGFKITDDIKVSGKDGRIDIRKYYSDKDSGELKPTKKGANISADEWASLRACFGKIDEALAQGPGAEETAASSSKAPANSVSAKKARSATADVAAGASTPDVNLAKRIKKVLKGRDLAQVSLGKLREELEGSLGLPSGALDDRKGEIKGIVTDLLNEG